MTSAAGDQQSTTVVVGGRYQVLGTLGEGGLAVVHRARDTTSGREIALKRLRPRRGNDRPRCVELFRREFHTLSHLVHPNVVSVYDYGIDEGDAYYTMELLDGGDLFDQVPCHWRVACALAHDVCSALALLHSRRMVFRDLSPKNVRCTGDGRAKLLDFGALAPMGPAKFFVGTPTISAPEAVHLQPLDARTDLYSLGATLYYALTGRRPYPATSINQLYELWKHPPLPPSALVPDVPPPLDALLLSMLQPRPEYRPESAAETLERLGGIAGLERNEALQVVSRAYLSTPILVGRDVSLAHARRRIGAASAGAGGAILVRGPRGVGRTRFLAACVLEAKIAGCVVLRADATDTRTDSTDRFGGEYGAARALGAELVAALPEVARRCAPALSTLEAFVPSLSTSSGRYSSESTSTLDDLQSALREWFLRVSCERPLFIAADDIDRLDLPSASLLALLAHEARDRPLLVAASMPSDSIARPSRALRLLENESELFHLAPIGTTRAERLLRSLFGDVPHVQHTANRLHALAAGLPRDFMQLAQHLVDSGIARYHGGSWSLPQRLDPEDLPADMAQARRARIDALGADARRLAQALALAPEGTYSAGECVFLAADAEHVLNALDELVTAEVFAVSRNDYSLAELGWREALLQSVAPAERRSMYLRLAEVFARRPAEGFRAARCLLDAGEDERGLDVLLQFTEASMRENTANVDTFARGLQSLPDDWSETYRRGIELCRKLRRSGKDTLLLYSRVTNFASQLGTDAEEYYGPLLEQLTHDAGLDVYRSSDATSAEDRLAQSIATARRRHAEGGDGSVLPPEQAIGQLGRTIASATGCLTMTLSVDLLKLLPSLDPLVPLAAGLASWEVVRRGASLRMLGQAEGARDIYLQQLERLARPDKCGLEDVYHVTQVLNLSMALGIIEAGMGLEQALQRASVLASSSLHEVNALRLKALYHLWQGDLVSADAENARAELLAIASARRQTNEGGHLPRELHASALMEDLTRVKRTIDAIEPFARHAAGWRCVLLWGQAEYERIRGNSVLALSHVDAALKSMHPAGHLVWAEAAAARVKILEMDGRLQDAAYAGLAYLEEAERRGTGYEQNYLRMALARVLARLGSELAFAHADRAIAAFCDLGTSGLNLGIAYETRARVALHLDAHADFRAACERCAEAYRVSSGGALAVRYERLLRDGRDSKASNPAPAGSASDFSTVSDPNRMLETLRDTSTAPRC